VLRKSLMAASAALLASMPVAAVAQDADQIETVTVTARKTAENLQVVPGSLSVLTADDLQVTGSNSVADLFARVPNVSMSGGLGGVLQGQFGIRGISTLVRNIGVETGMGIYVDGVYQGRPDNYNQELIDVSQVEVLRGPQGTIFGKNTIAGALNVTTVRPDDEVEGLASADFGNYGLKRFRGYVTAPLVDDTLSAKLSLGYVTRDGFYKNLGDQPDGDSLDMFSYRGSLYYTPTSNSSFVLTVDGLHDRGRPAFFQTPELLGFPSADTAPHTIDNNRPDYLHRDNYGVSLTGTVDLSFGTITSITAYRQSAYRASLDDDQNQVDYMAVDNWGDRTWFWSQEVRLNGQFGDDLKYVAGLYYLGQNVSTDRLFALGTGLLVPGEPLLTTRGHVGSREFAAYGNVDYSITDALTASLGLRYTYEQKDVDFVQGDPTGFYGFFVGYPGLGYVRSTSDGDVSPTFSLSYRFSQDAMGYVRIARGYKSAAFNVDLVRSTDDLMAKPENATTYEAGIKSAWFDNRVRANASVFTTKYNDMQVQEVQGASIVLGNAAKATIDGAELEIEALILPELRVDLGVGALNPRYDAYDHCPFPQSLGGGTTDCSGNQIIAAPDWTGNVGLEYTHPIGDEAAFISRVEYNFQSPVYFDATNSKRFESDARGLVNMRAGVDFGKYSVLMWVENLGNDTYVTYADDRSAVGVLKTTAYGAPRTFGATLSAKL